MQTTDLHLRIYKNGKVGIGGNIGSGTPRCKIACSPGDVKVTGSAMLMGNLTTTERDALTALME